jgi:hypothetical protein
MGSPEGTIGANAGREPDEREESIQRPHGSSSSAGAEQGRQYRARWAIENGRIVELRSEKGEDAHECDGPRNEGDPPHADGNG